MHIMTGTTRVVHYWRRWQSPGFKVLPMEPPGSLGDQYCSHQCHQHLHHRHSLQIELTRWWWWPLYSSSSTTSFMIYDYNHHNHRRSHHHLLPIKATDWPKCMNMYSYSAIFSGRALFASSRSSTSSSSWPQRWKNHQSYHFYDWQHYQCCHHCQYCQNV